MERSGIWDMGSWKTNMEPEGGSSKRTVVYTGFHASFPISCLLAPFEVSVREAYI